MDMAPVVLIVTVLSDLINLTFLLSQNLRWVRFTKQAEVCNWFGNIITYLGIMRNSLAKSRFCCLTNVLNNYL